MLVLVPSSVFSGSSDRRAAQDVHCLEGSAARCDNSARFVGAYLLIIDERTLSKRFALSHRHIGHRMPAAAPSPPMLEANLRSLNRTHQGKVRAIYEANVDQRLIVRTESLSAFDVVLPNPIPRKGAILTEISRFWFDRTRHIVPNHLTDRSLDAIVRDATERAAIADRSMVVRKLKALPIEAVVRGYLIGSG